MSRLVIAATFTAEPVAATLGYWCEALGLAESISFVPTGRVTQCLLDPQGDVASNTAVVLLRWEDWLRHLEAGAPARQLSALERVLTDLVDAVTVRQRRPGVPLLVGICPPSRSFLDRGWAGAFGRFDDELAWAVRATPDTHVIGLERYAQRYPVPSIYDPVADRMGHIPYSAEFFTVLGTLLARGLYSRRNPLTQIFLDPRELLWGVGDLKAQRALAAALRRQALAGRQVVFLGAKAGALSAHPELTLTERHVHEGISASHRPDAIVLVGPDTVVADRDESAVVRIPIDSAELTRQTLEHCWALDLPDGSRRAEVNRLCPKVFLAAPRHVADIRRAVAAVRSKKNEVP